MVEGTDGYWDEEVVADSAVVVEIVRLGCPDAGLDNIRWWQAADSHFAAAA